MTEKRLDALARALATTTSRRGTLKILVSGALGGLGLVAVRRPTQAATCAHPICVAGVKLASDCDPCVTKVCSSDAFCCSSQWDSTCISEAKSTCNMTC
jgi:hypothetical protein